MLDPLRFAYLKEHTRAPPEASIQGGSTFVHLSTNNA
jgi:hypothetical protein